MALTLEIANTSEKISNYLAARWFNFACCGANYPYQAF
jgi:hypothetical protein